MNTAQSKSIRTTRAISTLLSGVAGLALASNAMAQEAAAGDEGAAAQPAENEIVVSGIRGTIQNSLEEKRNSVEVFDALSADEIGDLPALSIGEALETLTGAGSHREQGGATEISIRGLGPFLGSTVINGRIATNGSGDRSVNFSQFPSELFSKVGIYKTQAASYIEGGVAGQIVLETVKPLDYGKRRIQGQFKLNVNPDNLDIDADQRFQKFGYRGTISYVDQFNVGDGELGISLGYQRNSTTNPEQETQVSNTIRACSFNPALDAENDGIIHEDNCDTDTSGINALGSIFAGEEPFAIARNSYLFRSNITEDTRDAFFGAVQYKPTPDVDINADFQYSKRLFREQRSDLNFSEGRRITPDGDLNNIGADLGLSDILVTTDSGALRLFTNETRIEAGSEYLERDEEYYGGGLSVDAQVSDRLKISIDASYSRTERIEQQIQARFRTDSVGSILGTFDANGDRVLSEVTEDNGDTNRDRVETLTQIFQNGSEGLNFIVQNFDVTDHNLFAGDARLRIDLDQNRVNEVWALRGDIEYEMDGFFSTIMAGARYQQLFYSSTPGGSNATRGFSRFEFTGYDQTPVTGALAIANQECRTAFPESGFLSSISGGNPLVTNVDAAGNVIGTANSYATFDARCIVQVLEREDPQGVQFDSDGNVVFPTGEFDSIQNSEVEERSWALYGQANFDTDLGDLPVRGNVGLRVVGTDVISDGFRGTLSSITAADGTVSLIQDNSNIVPITAKNSYTEFLPSLNLVADFQPDLLGRFAVYRALSRPDPSDLSSGRTFTGSTDDSDDATSIGEIVGTANATGNPFTDPLLSWNVDVGLEWYPNDDTILAFNAYYKSFDGGFETVGQFENFTVDGQDLSVLVTTANVSEDTSTIYGLEITAAHRFSYLPAPLDGLGFKLSYNYADSDFEFEDDTLGARTTVNDDGTTTTTPGIIPPANLFGFSKHVLSAQLYYEIGPFDFQGVYKHRSDYFQQFISTPGRVRIVDDVSVFEARASIDITDNVTFTIEGLNLFNEPRTDFRGAPDDLGQVLVYGPRYFAGVRFKF
ncbi:TonB-dependent receptor [Altererythrobacter sp. RZ02]|uniref:TonB-dependent receptor n=1 Tax=Pontixanthobacter rizhaonensis TaxID=2730337 RepID=A0A848QEC4_9SPHN|nr:TonB-dependent receptor [Pontixanthobacter rizhaonensis]NMW31991.1 TonB-dependent receptor [Pontixanthobacter rizhaonensis]